MAPSSGGGWSVKWARLGSDESLTLLREGWQPFACFYAPVAGERSAGPVLILRRYNLPGDAT
jgi:hypothetical protein